MAPAPYRTQGAHHTHHHPSATRNLRITPATATPTASAVPFLERDPGFKGQLIFLIVMGCVFALAVVLMFIGVRIHRYLKLKEEARIRQLEIEEARGPKPEPIVLKKVTIILPFKVKARIFCEVRNISTSMGHWSILTFV